MCIKYTIYIFKSIDKISYILKMNKNHINRFFKRTKLKPQMLEDNSSTFSNTNNYKQLSTDLQGKNIDFIKLIQ